MAAPLSQPYEISWPANVNVSPELKIALGQQFANINECLRLAFSTIERLTNQLNATSAIPVSAPIRGQDGKDGEDGSDGQTGRQGQQGVVGATGVGVPGQDGEDGDAASWQIASGVAQGDIARLGSSNSFGLINPLVTLAESWIGPSSTTGVYFKAGKVGFGPTNPLRQAHILGSGQNTANLTDAGNTGGTIYIQDSNGSSRNGGAILFGASQGFFSAIKSILNDGTANTVGALAFSTRNATSDTSLTERMRLNAAGNLGINTTIPNSTLQVGNAASTNFSLGVYVDASNPYIPAELISTTNTDVTPSSWTNGAVLDLHNDVTGATSGRWVGLTFSSVDTTQHTAATAGIQAIATNSASCGDLAFYTKLSTNNTLTEWIRIKDTGNIGIGTTAPTALLHLKAGTATANTAPLKLTSGTVLTTAEAGAVEFTTDDFFATITTGAARKAFVLDNGSRLTSGKMPVATTNGRLVDSTATLQVAAGVTSIVASILEKSETGSDANILTYTTGGSFDEFLLVTLAADVSAITGTSVVVTVTWKDSGNATATNAITLTGVGDGTINVPINAFKSTSVVVSAVFVGVSTAYKVSAAITRFI